MPLPPPPISILDVEVKSNNIKKVQWIDVNNIVHEEYVTAEEFNMLVNTAKSNYVYIQYLKNLRDRTEDILVTASNTSSGTMVEVQLLEEPLKDKHTFLHCRGVFISKNDYVIDKRVLRVSLASLDYAIKIGDNLTFMYTYLNKTI